jgi:hypothetical protein
MTDLAITMSTSLPDESVDLFYKVIKPHMKDERDHTLQKRSYKAFVFICNNKKFVENNMSKLLEELKGLLKTCLPSSKKVTIHISLLTIL